MSGEQGLASLLAFTNPWEIVALLAALVGLRLMAAPVSPRHRWRGYILELADSGIIAVLLIFCIVRPFFIQAFLIPSGSMHPTLYEGDRIMVNKLVYFLRDPRHGEIVVFHAPEWADPLRRDFIKRIIGLPGDRICIRGGRVIRNGQPVDEPYVAEPPMYEWPTTRFYVLRPMDQPRPIHGGEIVVPPGYVFVLGDNRNASNDGHAWQATAIDGREYPCPFVPRQNVIGKAMFIFWPPQRIGLVR